MGGSGMAEPSGHEQPGWGLGVPAPAAAWGIWPGSALLPFLLPIFPLLRFLFFLLAPYEISWLLLFFFWPFLVKFWYNPGRPRRLWSTAAPCEERTRRAWRAARRRRAGATQAEPKPA